MNQNEEKNKICGLCLEACDGNFDEVDDIKAYMLEILQLKLKPSLNGEDLICKDCTGNLKKCSDLKTSYEYTQDCINSFSTRDKYELDLTEIYLKENQIKDKNNLPEDYAICRLCLKLIYHNNCWVFLSDETKDLMLLKLLLSRYFSELDLKNIHNLAVCTSCQLSLHVFLNFMRKFNDQDCVKNDCQVKDSAITLRDTLKCEINDIDCNMPKEVKSEFEKVDIKMENVEFEGSDENNIASQSEVSHTHAPIDIKSENDLQDETQIIYRCDLCSYTSDLKLRFEGHILGHQSARKPSIYNCHLCDYKTKRKSNLKQHMLTHQDGVTLFKCELCIFQTKYKGALKLHMVVHQDTSEITMFRCEICSFVTKRKGNLKEHMRMHQDHDEATIYRCANCDYETKRKNSLRQHSVVHQDISEAKGYLCEFCGIKIKRIGGFKKHLWVHRIAPEYNCQRCKYKTKHKKFFEKHTKTHRDVHT